MRPQEWDNSHKVQTRWASVLLFMAALAWGLASDVSQGASTPVPAIVVGREDGDLYAVALDGSRTVRLTRTRAAEEEPAVSRDGRMIAFARRAGGISTMRLDGSHQRIVTRGPDSSPAWAPDGRTIYFVRYRRNKFGASCGSIFAVLATGRNIRRVTDAFATDRVHGETDEDPAVSPDGRRIAFSDWNACEGGTSSPRLRVVDPAGRPTRDLARLRNNGYEAPEHAGPDWSPDGGRLAYFKNNRYSDLTIANRDGSRERLVARGRGDLSYAPPAWSPNGRWIAFTRDAASRQLLLVVHPDGTGLRRLAETRSGGYSIGGWLPRLPR
jgi:Tol biopolymer transport system component